MIEPFAWRCTLEKTAKTLIRLCGCAGWRKYHFVDFSVARLTMLHQIHVCPQMSYLHFAWHRCHLPAVHPTTWQCGRRCGRGYRHVLGRFLLNRFFLLPYMRVSPLDLDIGIVVVLFHLVLGLSERYWTGYQKQLDTKRNATQWMYYMSRRMTKPAKWPVKTGNLPSLIRPRFMGRAKDPNFLQTDSEDSGLIWVFAGRTGHLVGFVIV